MSHHTSILSGKWGDVWYADQYPGETDGLIIDALALGLPGLSVIAGDGGNVWTDSLPNLYPKRQEPCSF